MAGAVWPPYTTIHQPAVWPPYSSIQQFFCCMLYGKTAVLLYFCPHLRTRIFCCMLLYAVCPYSIQHTAYSSRGHPSERGAAQLGGDGTHEMTTDTECLGMGLVAGLRKMLPYRSRCIVPHTQFRGPASSCEAEGNLRPLAGGIDHRHCSLVPYGQAAPL